MAHDTFLGTFNKAQFDRFATFARSQLPLIQARIDHLETERSRIGTIQFTWEQGRSGRPATFTADPPQSYIGKLLSAYEILGGDPFLDLRLRLRANPVFVQAGDVDVGPSVMSSGEAIGERGLSDATSGDLVALGRGWVDDTLRRRFSGLERKMRRALDYSDELGVEIRSLQRARLAATSTGSFEFFAAQIDDLLNDPNYRAITTDDDPLALLAYAPFAPYDQPLVGDTTDPNAIVDRPPDDVRRQQGGLVKPQAKRPKESA